LKLASKDFKAALKIDEGHQDAKAYLEACRGRMVKEKKTRRSLKKGEFVMVWALV
jgi:hypothetical protein